MKRFRLFLSIVMACVLVESTLYWMGCGSDSFNRTRNDGGTGGDGSGITGETTFEGNMDPLSEFLAGLQVCIVDSDPEACTDTDAEGLFGVGSDLFGTVFLSVGDTESPGSLCLNNVPDGAVVTLTDVLCDFASGFCTPASISTDPEPTEPVVLCQSTPGDEDGDGVPDDEELCPGTEVLAIVDADGCSIAQLVPCDGDWNSHGDYVSTVEAVSSAFEAAGALTHEERTAIVVEAAQSDCGKDGGDDDDDDE